MDEQLLEELIKSRKILKKKFESIKLGETVAIDKLENTFKPLTEPLKKLIKLSNEKTSRENLSHYENSKFETSTPKKKFKIEDNFDSGGLKKYKHDDVEEEEEESEDGNDDEDTNDDSFYSQTEDVIDLSILKGYGKLDSIYGANKDENGVWKFGNTSLKLNNDKIIIGKQSWAFTPGLYELLFYKKPQNYDGSELEIYKKILLSTNAHKRKYEADGQIKGNRGYKYKKIIKGLFETTYGGKGMGIMKVNLEKPNYIYWDDPNELVERLKLLVASQNAGHSNQSNEIISIIEELREANIIY